jgi:DNA-directed RNA polymerase subunit RPC12/RpoP
MEKKRFIRTTEDFICEHCGTEVKGDGYTNHCPHCLFSKHVDLHTPGDRLNPCKGLMEPVGYFTKGSEYIIVHRCLRCGQEKNNYFKKGDNFDALLSIYQ